MTLSIKEKMQEDLEDITNKLGNARDKALVANERVERLEREEYALQSALDVLNGKSPVVPAYKPAWPSIPPGGLGTTTSIPWGPTSAQQNEVYVDFNGDKILLEPGFKVGKNSFGEDVLLPEGLELAPMNEPIRPGQPPPSLLPPIGGDEGFASDIPTLGQDLF